MKQVLRQLAQHGELSWLSYHFAEFIARHGGTHIDDLVPLSAALVSEANRQGHVCISLARRAGRPLFASSHFETPHLPLAGDVESWRETLLANPCVAPPAMRTPLTLDATRLYLNRFWHYEDRVAIKIDALATTRLDDAAAAQVDLAPLDADQLRAVHIATSRRFSVISGGPGSGKTTIIIHILQSLLARNPACRVALAAPTGKAAARMMDSIRQRIDNAGPALPQLLPAEASTVHRLLGYSRQGFNYNHRYPLALDCVIVDEASMIDLQLMYHLLEALPTTASLILLGDRDQLASVAAGNVLGDITGHGYRFDASPASVAPTIALLRHNYRFDRGSAIGELAQLVNAGDGDQALALLVANGRGLHWYHDASAQQDAFEWVIDAYLPIFDSPSASAALDRYESTRVLCVTNSGPVGVDAVNAYISAKLPAADYAANEPFSGMPIMITRNHHTLGLYNGDAGILWRDTRGLRAYFRDGSGGVRHFALNRLPEFTTAWATTVHKSQGSEFDAVLLLLPSDPASDALSRELLYTAITRARRHFGLLGTRECFAAAAARLIRRESGLAQKLGWRAAADA